MRSFPVFTCPVAARNMFDNTMWSFDGVDYLLTGDAQPADEKHAYLRAIPLPKERKERSDKGVARKAGE